VQHGLGAGAERNLDGEYRRSVPTIATTKAIEGVPRE
jgi:hypothetical protein